MIRYAAELLGKSLLKKLTGLRYSEYLKTGQIAFIIEFLLTISAQNVFSFSDMVRPGKKSLMLEPICSSKVLYI